MAFGELDPPDWPDSGGTPPFDFVIEGLLAGTLVATTEGWVAVEELEPGDLLLTFDGHERPVQAVQIAAMTLGPRDWPRKDWPLSVPDGVIGNRGALRLLPGQPVLLESDLAEAMFGDPFALIPAAALEGWRGIYPEAPRTHEEARLLMLGGDAVIYANGEVLIYCPADNESGLPGLDDAPPADEERLQYNPLTLADARALVAVLIQWDQEDSATLIAAPSLDQAALRAVSP